jgi:PhnB protein
VPAHARESNPEEVFPMSDCMSFIPHIVVSNAPAAIDFYKKAFGATEVARHVAPNSSKIMHAMLEINGGHLILNDDFSEAMGQRSSTPEALGGTPLTLHMQVADADAAWSKAVSAGAEIVFPLKDQFWGDRYGQVRDPFGHKWSIAQTIAKPTAEELEQGAKKSLEQTKQHAHA